MAHYSDYQTNELPSWELPIVYFEWTGSYPPANSEIKYTMPQARACPYCSTDTSWTYHNGPCTRIKTIEYYSDGTIKRIEFRDARVES